MKTRNRLISLLLALAMVMSLAACGKSSAPAEPAPEETPKISAEEAYAGLVEATAAVDTYKMELSSTLVRNVAGTPYTESETATVRVKAAGEKEMNALYDCDRSVESNGVTTKLDFERSFVSGRAYYADDEGNKFYMQMSPEDFVSLLMPAVMMTADNYESIAYAEDGSTIELNGGKDFEAWMDSGNAAFISASGSVVPAEDGTVAEASFTAEYTRGGTEYTLTVDMSFAPDTEELAVTADKSEFAQTDDIRAPEYVRYARSALNDSLLSVTTLIYASSEYNTCAVLSNDDGSVYEAADKREAEAVIATATYTAKGVDTTNTTTTFHDGTLTVETDDKTVSEEESDGAELAQSVRDKVGGYLPTAGVMTRIYLTDACDCWEIFFEGSDEQGEALTAQAGELCNIGDESLEELSTDHNIRKTEGSITIDKDTLLPVAVYQYSSAAYTINEHKYTVSNKINSVFTVADESIYYDLTDELLPENEPETQATPLFYEVTAPNGGKMWLLGTIHVGDERTGKLPQEIYDALYSSDALAVECDVDSFEENLDKDERLQQKYFDAFTYSDGTMYWDHIKDNEVYEETVKLLARYGNDLLFSLFPYKVTMVSSNIENSFQKLGRRLFDEKGVDKRLMQLAKENDIKLLEVESVQFQIGMLGGFSDEIQNFELMGTVYEDRYSYNDSIQELLDLWCEGDEAALREYLADEEEDEPEEMSERERREYERYALAYEDYNEQMLIKRNDNMLKVAQRYVNGSQTVFFAVGLAHLIGENGLVDALREAGYTVEQVTYAG